jgi:hypothetical protein
MAITSIPSGQQVEKKGRWQQFLFQAIPSVKVK